MIDQNSFTPENYLLWWCLSGGIPKYLEWIIDAQPNILETLISDDSPLIKEGYHRLVEDFGDRKGHNEIDIVAINDTHKRAELYSDFPVAT